MLTLWAVLLHIVLSSFSFIPYLFVYLFMYLFICGLGK